ncbi:unnamed protein product [marine sediment metagenome]|uniref:Uncharacterized protein n=1 Tax=marine sediment metagenome TaxID=412755 RepID=X0YXE5_9ZZZZ
MKPKTKDMAQLEVKESDNSQTVDNTGKVIIISVLAQRQSQ